MIFDSASQMAESLRLQDQASREDPLVTLRNVGHVYADDGTHVLNDISLTLRQGDFVTLVGASGIGKSTLLR